jgi:hypothetical protein
MKDDTLGELVKCKPLKNLSCHKKLLSVKYIRLPNRISETLIGHVRPLG